MTACEEMDRVAVIKPLHHLGYFSSRTLKTAWMQGGPDPDRTVPPRLLSSFHLSPNNHPPLEGSCSCVSGYGTRKALDCREHPAVFTGPSATASERYLPLYTVDPQDPKLPGQNLYFRLSTVFL